MCIYIEYMCCWYIYIYIYIFSLSISKISTFDVLIHILTKKEKEKNKKTKQKKSIFELNMVFWWCALPIHIWEIIWQHYGTVSENAACVNLFFLFFLCCRPWLKWSHIYGVCHWGWMRDGIQSNQILLILPEEHME